MNGQGGALYQQEKLQNILTHLKNVFPLSHFPKPSSGLWKDWNLCQVHSDPRNLCLTAFVLASAVAGKMKDPKCRNQKQEVT